MTAYDEFALRAFEVHAVDYLLKPVAPERLALALSRVPDRTPPQPTGAMLRASARKPGEFLERVVIRDGVHVHVVAVDKIDYVEAQDDYVGFKTAGKILLKEQTLADVESSLDPRRFVRIHRSYHPERRAAVPRGVVREGQPHCHPRRWQQAPGQPIGLSAAATAAVNGPVPPRQVPLDPAPPVPLP